MKKLFLLLLAFTVVSRVFAVTPADPTNVVWYDCGNESGQSYVTFTLPTVDINGNPLDIEMMGYRIYIDDDQIVSFSSTQYENLYGTTTDLYYYNWETGTDIQSNGVYIYRTNADGYERFFNNRIGVQVFYLNDNFSIGDVSNIVYTELAAALPKPAVPEAQEFIEYGVSTGCYLMFGFNTVWDGSQWQLVAEDGSYLDVSKVSYSIFTDNDQILTFDEEHFANEAMMGLEMPTTEIPYEYEGFDVNNYDIHFTSLSTESEDPFFTWRIGLRTNYTDGDQTSYSDIYYMEIFPQLKPAAEVTTTSFLADWSCDDENTHMINNFIGGGYDLYVINKGTNDTIVYKNVPVDTAYHETYGYAIALPGATQSVEGLTPGATYQYYVVVRQNTGKSYQSVVQEVTLPGSDHNYAIGDVNHDNVVDVEDVTALISYILGNSSDICTICGDVNEDAIIDVEDVTALINIVLGNSNL